MAIISAQVEQVHEVTDQRLQQQLPVCEQLLPFLVNKSALFLFRMIPDTVARSRAIITNRASVSLILFSGYFV